VNCVVVGGGAVGSLLAWALSTGGAGVTLIRRRPMTPERGSIAINRRGPSEPARVTIVSSIGAVDGRVDAILLAVKAYDVEATVGSLPASPATIVTVQNGISSEEVVLDNRPSDALVAASLTASVELATDGSVRWRRRGGIGLAPAREGGPATAGEFASVFRRGGLPARVYPDWRAMKWSKLIGNLVGNATSALLDMPPRAIYSDPALFEIERAQLREAFAVMRALGLKPVALSGADIRPLELGLRAPALVARPILSRIVASARGGKDPSLRIGMTAGNGPPARSEISWLNGAVARTGAALGVPTPVNAALVDLVERSMTDADLRTTLRRQPSNLVTMLAEPASEAAL
jgi:2-dehydropantoate 2-reductase